MAVSDKWPLDFDDKIRIAACVGIARQICGHAYPDKTFDELEIGEIQVVQHNLKWADETLAEIMPIVVDCTGAIMSVAIDVQHDAETCPIHEDT